jgi:hypothetical protein
MRPLVADTLIVLRSVTSNVSFTQKQLIKENESMMFIEIASEKIEK